MTEQQGTSFENVIERIAQARCDRDRSCNRIGPGAVYAHREDCLQQVRTFIGKDVNAASCPGGVGEVALNRCVKSLEIGRCDMPGQVVGVTSHCRLADLCMKQ